MSASVRCVAARADAAPGRASGPLPKADWLLLESRETRT